MSDLAYFQGLLESAKDPAMIAYYQTAVRLRNRGTLGACQHADTLPFFERSYGILYSWELCQDCGTELNSKRLDHIE